MRFLRSLKDGNKMLHWLHGNIVEKKPLKRKRNMHRKLLSTLSKPTVSLQTILLMNFFQRPLCVLQNNLLPGTKKIPLPLSVKY